MEKITGNEHSDKIFDLIPKDKLIVQVLQKDNPAKDIWLNRLKEYSMEKYGYNEKSATDYMNCDDWETYYQNGNGYSPEDAVDTDMSYAAEN